MGSGTLGVGLAILNRVVWEGLAEKVDSRVKGGRDPRGILSREATASDGGVRTS